MRLTWMGQLIKRMVAELRPASPEGQTSADLARIEKHLQSVKWNLWQSNVPHALQRIAELEDDLEMLEKNLANKKKLQKAVKEMLGYISANKNFIPNYRNRYRLKETISTAFVEST